MTATGWGVGVIYCVFMTGQALLKGEEGTGFSPQDSEDS